jgi:hypothetical protein
MRYYISSVARAKSLAHDLMSLVYEIANRRIPYTIAQNATAIVCGYSDWKELKTDLTTEKPRSLTSLDETLEPEFLRERLRQQASVLVDTLHLEREQAALVVAHLRISAHPAGPHRIEGPCSSLDVRGTPREYRGTHADGRPIVLVAGCERSLSLAAVAVGYGRGGKAVPAIVLNAGPSTGDVRLRSGMVDMVRHQGSSAPRHLEVPADLADPNEDQWWMIDGYEPPVPAGPDLTVLEDEDYIGVIARERWNISDMRVIRVRIGKGVNSGLLEATARYMRADTPEAVFKAQRLGAGDRRYGMRSPHLDLLDCLVRCGLVDDDGKSRHLGFYQPQRERRGVGPAGVLLDDERERQWKAIVADTDLTKVNRALDVEGIALLRHLDTNMLLDEATYNRIQPTSGSHVARECLLRIPMLFKTYLASPELAQAIDFTSLINIFVCGGASCDDDIQPIPVAPIPAHVMSWMIDRNLSFQATDSGFINSCIAALSALPASRLPHQEREWRALQILIRELGGAVESPIEILGVESVLNFMRAEVRVPSHRRHDGMPLFPKSPSRPNSFGDHFA